MTEPEKQQQAEPTGTTDTARPASAANDAAPAEQPAAAAEAPAAAPEAPAPSPLEAEVAELKDKLLRAHADMENLRRRAERDREDVHKFAVSKFARDLLSVADNLRRALDSAPKEADEAVKSFIEGVEVTERELLGIFERHQVKQIHPLGERFDANFHEAVFEVEDAGKPAGTVIQVMAPGYTIAGRLLRAAMVGVSRGGPREPAAAKLDTSA